MNVIVFSNPSYSGSHARVGLQIIAELLAERGHEVDYAGIPSHPLDFLSPSRRSNYLRAWSIGGDKHPRKVVERLSEYYLRAPFTRSRAYWLSSRQVDLYCALAPRWLASTRYDVCMRDTAMSGLFAGRVDARMQVLRLNDDPDALVTHIHPVVIARLKQQIREGFFQEIWATNPRLVEMAKSLNAHVATLLVPNGVRIEHFTRENEPHPRTKSAVYVGAFNEWFDADLLAAAAGLLPDWEIDLYGPSSPVLRSLCGLTNVSYRGPVPFSQVPQIMRRYRVGLVPFGHGHPMLNGLDPLKAYQYLACGLGIAATSHGTLGVALADFARFGNTPAEFAAAIRHADGDRERLAHSSKVRDLLAARSWTHIVRGLEQRMLSALDAGRSETS